MSLDAFVIAGNPSFLLVCPWTLVSFSFFGGCSPPFSLVCPWTLVRSWEHLSSSSLFPLSLFSPSFPFPPSCLGVPGCFRHSWEPFFSLGVSLDACVVAGNTFFSFLPTPPSCRDLRVGLRIWFLRLACDPAVKSVHKIISVCVCAPCSHRDPLGLFCFCFHFAEQGVQGTVETAPNEAIHLCWKQSLISSVYLLEF